jgi:ATP-dependent Clp protease ATP-binding subunit ClpC
MMGMVRKELEDKQIDLEITDAAREYLGEHGFDPVLGARPLRRLIQNEVEDRLSDELLGGRVKAGEVAIVDMQEGEIVIRARSAVEEAVPSA